MARYRVKPGQHVTYGDDKGGVALYEAGDVIDLTTKQAEAMPWAVEPLRAQAPAQAAPPKDPPPPPGGAAQ